MHLNVFTTYNIVMHSLLHRYGAPCAIGGRSLVDFIHFNVVFFLIVFFFFSSPLGWSGTRWHYGRQWQVDMLWPHSMHDARANNTNKWIYIFWIRGTYPLPAAALKSHPIANSSNIIWEFSNTKLSDSGSELWHLLFHEKLFNWSSESGIEKREKKPEIFENFAIKLTSQSNVFIIYIDRGI